MRIKTYVAGLGLVCALGVVIPAPTLAQGAYSDQNGVGVNTWRPRRDDPDARTDAYGRGDGRCRTITIQRANNSIEQIRRCD